MLCALILAILLTNSQDGRNIHKKDFSMNAIIFDSLEPFELKYKDSFIITRFPEYAQFWCRFIGCHTDATSGKPTPKFSIETVPSDPNNQRRLEKIYRRLTQEHYSQLIHLVMADETTEAMNPEILITENDWESAFTVSEQIYCAYAHMYSALDLERQLWQSLRQIQDANLSFADAQKRNIRNHLSSFGITAPANLASVEDSIGAIRNLTIHRTRLSFAVDENKKLELCIPSNRLGFTDETPLWEDLHNSGIREPPKQRSKTDYENLLLSIRNLRSDYIKQFAMVLKATGNSLNPVQVKATSEVIIHQANTIPSGTLEATPSGIQHPPPSGTTISHGSS